MSSRMVAIVLAAALASTSCSKQLAPVVTIAGVTILAIGAVGTATQHCSDGCVSTPLIPAGIIGVPLVVIGGLSWLAHIGDPDDPPAGAATPVPPPPPPLVPAPVPSPPPGE